MIATGLFLGLADLVVLMRVLSGVLYGVNPTDAATFSLVSLLLSGVGLIACCLPAWRASKIDPLTTPRYQ